MKDCELLNLQIYYVFKFNVEEDDAAILEYLRDCMGRRIGVAKFFYCDEREKLAAVSEILGRTKIDLLQVVNRTVSDLIA